MLMSSALQLENNRLREQLSQLLEQARTNQEIMQRYQAFDLQCIGADRFQDLIHCVIDTLPVSSDLEVVRLTLFDPEREIRQILQDLCIDCSGFSQLVFLERPQELGLLQGRLPSPLLGPYVAQAHERYFPQPVSAPAPASIAIVPLRRKHQLIGVLCLGSADDGRFVANMATDFIEHMASIIAVCLENVINTERLKHIGLTDRLTGVNTRRYIEQRLLEETGRTQRQGYALSCLYIDIDHFKKINDQAGHQAGDQVLREVATRIKAELRLSDALGRFGGEEFVTLLIDAQLPDALLVAERIRASIASKPFIVSGINRLVVTVSIGVATLLKPQRTHSLEESAAQLVADADAALYRAKNEGRNRVIGAPLDIEKDSA
jgi:two-component system cell cycle response regulator